MPSPLHLRLPATSANLGPGFDALGLALALYLTIDATIAPVFSIQATGRDGPLCASLENNLILSTYTGLLAAAGRPSPPLHLLLHNQIPLGMGCGSSAAALLAGVFLANHFGDLAWPPQQILEEACRREGHPDNVAACFLGGMTSSMTVTPAPGAHTTSDHTTSDHTTVTASLGRDLTWRILLAIPRASLSTSTARALLPETYPRQAAVANVQASALLVSAFALDRPDLLRFAMRDHLHQPFRSAVCPLLPRLLPLAGSPGIHGVSLSGAGPSVLLLADPSVPLAALEERIQHAAAEDLFEILETHIAGPATCTTPEVTG